MGQESIFLIIVFTRSPKRCYNAFAEDRKDEEESGMLSSNSTNGAEVRVSTPC